MESGGKCTDVFSNYWIFIDDYGGASNWAFTPHLTTSQGATAFYNPNNPILGESLGLPTFSGYTKCVDVLITKVATIPYVISLVFYEDT